MTYGLIKRHRPKDASILKAVTIALMKKIYSSSTHRQDTDRLILSRKLKTFLRYHFWRSNNTSIAKIWCKNVKKKIKWRNMIDKRPRWINSGTVLRHHWKPEKRKTFSLLMSAMTTPSDYLGLSRLMSLYHSAYTRKIFRKNKKHF